MSRAFFSALAGTIAAGILLGACHDGSEAPSDRPGGAPHQKDTPGGGSSVAPLDLVYVCGNTFLATNRTSMAVPVTYRVAETDETGELTLEPGFEDDPGFSETELETRQRGAVELYRDGKLVARRSNGALPCGSPAELSVGATASAAGAGSWTAPFSWPIVALEVSVLPNGKVLTWGHTGNPEVWDPATGSFSLAPEPSELFCAGLTVLADGRVFAAGGNISTDHGTPNINLFDPASSSWSGSTPMRKGRWYPTPTMLANGDVVIMAGRDQAGAEVTEPEVWSGGSMKVLSGASRILRYYPRTFLAPNGLIFYAGEDQATSYLDPSGNGSWIPVGNRLYGRRDYGAAVMYEPGKILYVGGGRTTSTAELIDLTSPAPNWRWTGSMSVPRRHLNATVLPTGEVLVTGGTRGTAFNSVDKAVHSAELWSPVTGTWTTLASNTISRTYHATSVLLPDGRVLHAGSGDGGSGPAQRNAELFSPPYLQKGARPSITSAPSSVAYGEVMTIATPDGAAITKVSFIRLGATTHAFDMNQRFEWLSFTRSAGGLEVTAPSEPNLTPPGHYLLFILNGNGVPSVGKIVRISGAAPPHPLGTFSLSVTGRSDATTQYMTLKWSGAKSAAVDMYRNGRLRKSTPNDGQQGESRAYTAAATYIYKVCEAGTYTCSNPASVSFKGGATTANTAPISAFTSKCSDLGCDFSDGSVDLDGSLTAWQWSFGDGSTSSQQNPSHSYSAGGTYQVGLTATDNRSGKQTTSHSVTVVEPAPPPVENKPPVASFSFNCSDLSCTFTDESSDSDGKVTGWAWNFDDGTSSTDQSPIHVYEAAGTYSVTLEATDDKAATNSVSQTVSVTAAAAP